MPISKSVTLLIAFVGFSASSLEPTTNREEVIRHVLQPILDEAASRWNISISYAFYDGTTAVELAAGIQDHARQIPAKTSDIYPVGSVTKSWTAAGILQLVERGVLHLDDPVSPHVDEILRREAKTSFLELLGRKFSNITIRQLLSHRSGMPDYNDTAIKAYTISHPNKDIGPYELLKGVSGQAPLFKPGTGGSYTGLGYVLLGLVLAQYFHPDHPSWQTYDQKSVLPASLRQKSTAHFPLRGPCKQYAQNGMVHQYAPIFDSSGTVVREIRDLFDDSCLNGWTCGNMAARPLDLASFYWHLLHRGPDNKSPILTPTSIVEMQNFKPLTMDDGVPYGLGIFRGIWTLSGYSPDDDFIGHSGEDWGSAMPIAGYDRAHKYGMAFSTNSPIDMTYHHGKFTPSYYMQGCLSCQFRSATNKAIGVGQVTDCGWACNETGKNEYL